MHRLLQVHCALVWFNGRSETDKSCPFSTRKANLKKDDYEFNRDQERERRKLKERGANEYLYGAKYDNDGKLLNAGSLYEQKHVKKKTLQLEAAEKASNEARQKAASAADEVRRLEASRKKEAERVERQRAVERQAEIERQRKAKANMAAEKDRLNRQREQEEAWKRKQQRIADAREKEAYRARVKKLASEHRSRIDEPNSNRRKRSGGNRN